MNEAREAAGREPYDDELADQPLVGGQPLGGQPEQDPLAGVMGEEGGMPPGEQPNPADSDVGVEGEEEPPAKLKAESLQKGANCLVQRIPQLIEEGHDLTSAITIATEDCYADEKCEDCDDGCGSGKEGLSQKASSFDPVGMVLKASVGNNESKR